MEKTCSCLLLLVATTWNVASALEETSSAVVGEPRDGTFQLSGGNSNNAWTSALFIVPVLLMIVLLDFAIFGTFASRSDDLNPVSRFFFHARNGMSIVRNRHRKAGYLTNPYDNRQSRSLEAVGPVLDALSQAQSKYEE